MLAVVLISLHIATAIGCDLQLGDPSGTFTSPNYPENYPPYLDCTYNVSIPGGFIYLEFEDWELEGGSGCPFDYVTIYDGFNFLGRFCNDKTPGPFLLYSTEMSLQFRTDVSVQRRGFKANYRTQFSPTIAPTEPPPTDCGGYLRADIGWVSSPNYPENYQNNLQCSWLIELETEGVILLDFIDFRLETSLSCQYDYLEIFDGSSEESPRLATLCGFNSVDVEATSKVLFLNMVTDDTINFRGFNASWRPKECHLELNDPSGTFMTPNYPEDYPLFSNCMFNISVPNGFIYLEFEDWELEDHVNCLYDYVVIYDGFNMLGRFCTDKTPGPFISSSTDMSIQFISDGSVNQRGFKANYRTQFSPTISPTEPPPTDCGGYLKADFGWVSSPNYPENYQNNIQCSWVIELESEGIILLDFTDFRLETSRACIYDYLEIFDGSSSESPRLAIFCGFDSVLVEATSKMVFLNMVTDDTINFRGFNASWKPKECHLELNDPSGTFMTPNYPEDYPPNSDCQFTISVLNGFVYLEFEDWELESEPDCPYDYVTIYDGFNLLGRFCSDKTPGPFISSSTTLTVQFISDGSFSYRGFKANYRTQFSPTIAPTEPPPTDCENFLMGDSGWVSSPSYPENYQNNLQCIWLIELETQGTILLNSTDFRLETGMNCQYDSLQIYDGNSSESPLLARLCGFSSFQVASTGQFLFLSMTTDNTINFRGFNASWIRLQTMLQTESP